MPRDTGGQPTCTSRVATSIAAPAPVPIPKEEKIVVKEIVCEEGATVDFQHEALETEVRRKLDQPEGQIKKSDLRKVRSVNLAKGEPLDYLDPCVFPYLTEVRDLFLGPGNLEDLSPLAALTKLSSLRASVNKVHDVSVLSKLVQLDRLDLGRTQVSDLTPLASLTNLTELQLDSTPIEDVSPLANLTKLERLSLRQTRVKDISSLKPLKALKQIDISGAAVDDPYALARPGLRVIEE